MDIQGAVNNGDIVAGTLRGAPKLCSHQLTTEAKCDESGGSYLLHYTMPAPSPTRHSAINAIAPTTPVSRVGPAVIEQDEPAPSVGTHPFIEQGRYHRQRINAAAAQSHSSLLPPHHQRRGHPRFLGQSDYNKPSRELQHPVTASRFGGGDVPSVELAVSPPEFVSPRPSFVSHQQQSSSALPFPREAAVPDARAAQDLYPPTTAATAEAWLAIEQQRHDPRSWTLEEIQLQAAEADVAAAEARRDFLRLLAKTQGPQQEGGREFGAGMPPPPKSKLGPAANSTSMANERQALLSPRCRGVEGVQQLAFKEQEQRHGRANLLAEEQMLRCRSQRGALTSHSSVPASQPPRFASTSGKGAVSVVTLQQYHPLKSLPPGYADARQKKLEAAHEIINMQYHPLKSVPPGYSDAHQQKLEAAQEIINISRRSSRSGMGAAAGLSNERIMANSTSDSKREFAAAAAAAFGQNSRRRQQMYDEEARYAAGVSTTSSRGRHPPLKKRRFSVASSSEVDDEASVTSSSPTVHAGNSFPPISNTTSVPPFVATSAEASGVGPDDRGEGAKNPEDAPRRPLSAYNCFFSDERERILRALDDPALSSESCSAASSDGMPDIAALDAVLARQWNDEHPASTMRPEDWEEEMRRKLILQRTSKKRPKRLHRKSHGKIGFHALTKLIGMRWKALESERRAYYESMAKLDMRRYRMDIAKWNDNQKMMRLHKQPGGM
mmetsp:Transcript_18549/g.53478  ORF Transcript_18549/g.53478 Transcript_18549/m.53478 type:complete len:722 (-) Transcript_18549:480-2645(-)|eukprot:CAMPEP_0113551566 /NCGR_PEP_ID=MMETSP0015_2-20120614/14593_1 /TAXON_ID=2838 /ORGANISM="Odontella" /LENGTH=721 /DNA_ID=CAMNT_0000452467 /DNA_START=316 /DNA_END=2481 /DNA_ORIENTATION=+ /assembly_acc=CAM_ASM_000160